VNIQDAIAHLQKNDPTLNRVFEETIRLPDFSPLGDPYYSLLESIVSQQLSVKAADPIFKRFIGLFPDAYPHPVPVLALEHDVLRGVGLSNQKAGYIKNVAQFAIENKFEQINWAGMNDEDIILFLTKIKGVGKWTVQMLLMFTLNRLNVFPEDDLGIQQGMAKLYGLDTTDVRQLKKQMNHIAHAWHPYRTVACRYLWRWKDQVNQ
jgi:DNA-3-methyladenine glycosylase II